MNARGLWLCLYARKVDAWRADRLAVVRDIIDRHELEADDLLGLLDERDAAVARAAAEIEALGDA